MSCSIAIGIDLAVAGAGIGKRERFPQRGFVVERIDNAIRAICGIHHLLTTSP